MSDPAFLQFASECKRVAFELRDDHERAQPGAVAIFEQAERHARLLAVVWEWANSDARGFSELDWDEAKAHVRALLAQKEEK